MSAIAKSKGLRFVAITRRGYKGSTPFSDEELSAISGSDSEKQEWLIARGCEIVVFVTDFIERENLPPISADGKKGGIALLGWSAGATFTAAAVVHMGLSRFASYLRAHILHGTITILVSLYSTHLLLVDPPSIVFGLPLPPQTYSPELDSFIPAKSQTAAFTIWITSYFQHGDLSTRDLNNLDYAVPATFRAPSIYNMSQSEIADMIDTVPYTTIDTPMMLGMMPQSNEMYKKALFDKSIRKQLPNMQVWNLIGDATASFGLAALWSMQDDDKAHGGNNVKYKIVPRMNHFVSLMSLRDA